MHKRHRSHLDDTNRSFDHLEQHQRERQAFEALQAQRAAEREARAALPPPAPDPPPPPSPPPFEHFFDLKDFPGFAPPPEPPEPPLPPMRSSPAFPDRFLPPELRTHEMPDTNIYTTGTLDHAAWEAWNRKHGTPRKPPYVPRSRRH